MINKKSEAINNEIFESDAKMFAIRTPRPIDINIIINIRNLMPIIYSGLLENL